MSGSNHGNLGELRAVTETPLRWCLPSAEEMRQLDQITIRGGVAGSELMRRAGTAIAQEMKRDYPSARRCVVVCGPGNNGGDGVVIARLLREFGVSVTTVIASSERYSEELRAQLRLVGETHVLGAAPSELRSACERCVELDDTGLDNLLISADIIVDALLGTGQKSAPTRGISVLARHVLRARAAAPRVTILSVDIPTGVDADTGAVFDPHIPADRTYAIECMKRGMVQFPAREACGAITLISIGLEVGERSEFVGIEGGELPRLPGRSPFAHKGDMGRILVVGGSTAMPGAPLLAAHAALRSGAGLVSRLVKRAWVQTLSVPECMNELIPGSEDVFVATDVKATLDVAAGFDTIVVGPGLGLARDTEAFVKALLEGLKLLGKRIVVDADAINLVARGGLSLRGLNAVMTPHPGEAGRLLGKPTPVIQADRFSAARELWELHQVVAVLKGAGTIVYDEGRGGVVLRGTPYLATAGSGDVLAGIIAACFSRMSSAFSAACLGAWVHARAGMLASERSGGPILASDIATATSPIIGAMES